MSKTLFNLVTRHGISNPAAFASWLDRCWATGFNHGSELLNALPLGVTEGSDWADRMLKGAMFSGWIIRSKFTPTPNQRFLNGHGLGGVDVCKMEAKGQRLPYCRPEDWDSYAGATMFGWEPNRDCVEAAEWLKAKSWLKETEK